MNAFQEMNMLYDMLFEGEITLEEYNDAMDELDPDHDMH